MNLCSNRHEEVCHEGRDCPVCSLRDDKNYEINELRAKIEELEEKVDELENQISEAEEGENL